MLEWGMDSVMVGVKAWCPFCLQEFDCGEKRTAHLIYDRCELAEIRKRSVRGGDSEVRVLPRSAVRVVASEPVMRY